MERSQSQVTMKPHAIVLLSNWQWNPRPHDGETPVWADIYRDVMNPNLWTHLITDSETHSMLIITQSLKPLAQEEWYKYKNKICYNYEVLVMKDAQMATSEHSAILLFWRVLSMVSGSRNQHSGWQQSNCVCGQPTAKRSNKNWLIKRRAQYIVRPFTMVIASPTCSCHLTPARIAFFVPQPLETWRVSATVL